MTRARGWIRAAGAPARGVIVGGIRLYRAALSGWLGGQCRFYPTCSHYGETAIRTHGALKGSALTVWRIARCNPFGRGGIEPVPPRHDASDDAYDEAYDHVIPTTRART
jgi:putative membrane protein insertion efficiency factor